MPTTRILIDSRAREGGDVKNFWLELVPTIDYVRKVNLVWADVPNPLQSPGGPYFLIRVPELGTRTRLIGSTTTSVTGGVATTTAGRRRGVIAGIATKIAVGVATTLIVDAITGEQVEDPDADPTAEPSRGPDADPTTAEEPAATLCVCSVTEGDLPVKH